MKPAKILRAAMEARNWDVMRLSRETGIDDSLLRRYLCEEVDIGLRNAPKLSKALSIPVTDLLFGSGRSAA